MEQYSGEYKIEPSTPKKRRKKKKKPSVMKKLLITIAAALVILFVFIMVSESKKEDDAESSAPAAEASAESSTGFGSYVTPDGKIKQISNSVDRIDLYYSENLKPFFDENFHGNYTITEYSNDLVVVFWDNNVDSDIDSLREGNSDARAAWEESAEIIHDASKQLTFDLRGYKPGANVALVWVDARNHEDILLISSNGTPMYDFDLDGDMDPWFLYQNYNEEIKDRKPNL